MSNETIQRPMEKFPEAASQSIVRGGKKRKKWLTANKSKDKI